MKKKLYRSKKDRMIAGVCGGLGEYFEWDATWLRIAWALSIFAAGFGILAYIVFWIVVPENHGQKESGKEEKKASKKDLSDGKKIIGLVLILLGILFLFENLFDWWKWQWIWAMLLIALGVILLMKAIRD